MRLTAILQRLDPLHNAPKLSEAVQRRDNGGADRFRGRYANWSFSPTCDAIVRDGLRQTFPFGQALIDALTSLPILPVCRAVVEAGAMHAAEYTSGMADPPASLDMLVHPIANACVDEIICYNHQGHADKTILLRMDAIATAQVQADPMWTAQRTAELSFGFSCALQAHAESCRTGATFQSCLNAAVVGARAGTESISESGQKCGISVSACMYLAGFVYYASCLQFPSATRHKKEACPKCGFTYKWVGGHCGHCGYP